MTPHCHKKLSSELEELVKLERPKMTEVVKWAAALGDRSENADYLYGKKRIREIDKRINFLSKRLENAEVIEPTSVSSDNVKFGATVTIEEEGEEKVVSIVGIDESDVKSGLISWVSPLGRSLLGKNEGDIASFQTPNGEREIEVIKIEYIDINFE